MNIESEQVMSPTRASNLLEELSNATIQLAETTPVVIESMKNIPSVANLKVVPFDGTNYKRWKMLMKTKLYAQGLLELVRGTEILDENQALSVQAEFHARARMAHAEIVFSLSPDISERLDDLIDFGNPVQLWDALFKEYGQGSAQNTVFMRYELYGRRLGQNENIKDFLQSLRKIRADMAKNNDDITDEQFAGIIQTNVVNVYPDIVAEYDERMREKRPLSLRDAISKLEAAERTRKVLGKVRKDIRQQDGGGLARHVNNVHQRRRGNQSHPYVKNGIKARNRIEELKKRTKCANCGEQGHWYRECPKKAGIRPLNNGIRSMANSVLLTSGSDNLGDIHGNSKGGGLLLSEPRQVTIEMSPTSHVNMCMVDNGESYGEWILDSGSQVNVCSDDRAFVSRRVSDRNLIMANGSVTSAAECGSVIMRVVNEVVGHVEDWYLPEVYYVKDSKVNLLSLSYMQQKCGFELVLGKGQQECWLYKHELILKFIMCDGLYRLSTQRLELKTLCIREQAGDGAQLVHSRLAHVGRNTILKLIKQGTPLGTSVTTKDVARLDCVPCVEGKMHRMSYKRRQNHEAQPLRRLAVDICSINTETICGSKMFLIVVDEATRYRWVFLLARKSQACGHIQGLIQRLHVKFQANLWRVNMLLGDQGGEFMDSKLKNFCENQGIQLAFTNGYSPQENGIAERSNGVLLPRLRSTMLATRLPEILWGEALQHVVYTVNRCPSQALNGRTPYECLYGTSPNIMELRTWGAVVFIHVPDQSRQRREKLKNRVNMCLMMGYSDDTSGYKLLHLTTGNIVTGRLQNLRMYETYTVEASYIKDLLENRYRQGNHELPMEIPLVAIRSGLETYTKPQSSRQLSELQMKHDDVDDTLQPDMKRQCKGNQSGEDHVTQDTDRPYTTPVADSEIQPRSKRVRKPNSRLQGFIVGNILNTTTDISIPRSFKEAKRSQYWSYWEEAMKCELQSLKDHGTWCVEDRATAGTNRVLTCKWVFAIKRDERGFIKRFKARLVVRGYEQEYGINYTDTFAPVIRFETIRAAIYFALCRNWSILQYDVKTAFLYGSLSEVIYMEQPPGFGIDSPTKICRLLKSLYGLKQAPNVWNHTLHSHLISIGFRRLDSDYGLYARDAEASGGIDMLLSVYVDDLLLMGHENACTKVASNLKSVFELTSLGTVKYLLGIEIVISKTRDQVVFCQRQYVQNILTRFHMAECNGTKTPEVCGLLASNKENKENKSQQEDYMPYREITGALQYLVSGSRPDIAHAVRALGVHLGNYNKLHFSMAKRVLRYVKETQNFGLVIDITSYTKLDIKVYCDADYANDPLDRLSVSGYVTLLNNNVISYGSRKQELNAQSTTEAEYVAMAEGTKDLQWIVGLCNEVKWSYEVPVLINDNSGAVYMSAKPGKHSRSKHIENKYHYVRHLREQGLIIVKQCPTDDMLADIFTKGLGRTKFEKFRKLLKVLPPNEWASNI